MFNIITIEDPRLRQVSQPVSHVNDQTRDLMDRMLQAMYNAKGGGGIGLAAVQVGVLLRVAVVDLWFHQRNASNSTSEDNARSSLDSLDYDYNDYEKCTTSDSVSSDASGAVCKNPTHPSYVLHPPLFIVNPQIIWHSKEVSTCIEGCLSMPGIQEEVSRPASIRISYLDRDGTPQELSAEGLLSTCIQHEIDHMNGKWFVDHLSRLKRDIALRKWQKIARSIEKRY